MIRLLIVLTCSCAIITACTRAQAQATKDTAVTVASFLGIPRPLGEAIGGAVLLALGQLDGHRRGRKRERRLAEQAATP